MKRNGQNKPFSNIELSSFCGQFALILKSGISALEGLSIMLEDMVSKEEKQILGQMLEYMQQTGSFYQALSHTGLFPAYMVHMVQIGEETGTLDEVMQALCDHYTREDSVVQAVKSAVTYPSIISGMMVVVIVILLVKVMPIFNQVFIQLGTEMTGFSKSLMSLGAAINRYSILLLVLLALLVALVLYGTKTLRGKQLFRKIGYKLPFIKSLHDQVAVCRFASGMSLTLSSGMDSEQSMDLVSALNDDPHFQHKLDTCRALMAQGETLSDAFRQSGIFTGMYSRMVSIASKTGTMDQVMSQISTLCQDDIDTNISNKLAILEPTLVIILSIIVGIILLSVMFPLMGIMANI